MAPASTSQGDTGCWPMLPGERNWKTWQLLLVFINTAAATWCYIIGEFVGNYLNLKMGFSAMTAGAMIGIGVVVAAVLPMASRFGIDSVTTAKAQFGSRGWMLISVLQYISVTGWNCLLLIFFAVSCSKLFETLGLHAWVASAWFKPLATLVACVVIYAILLRGASGVEKTSRLLFVIIVGVTAWILWMLLSHGGPALSEALPPYASDNRLENYAKGIEVGIVTNLTWWAYVGAMARVVPSASRANLPTLLGFGLTIPLMSLIGLASFLLLQDSDPAGWLISLGGTSYGLVALILVLLANIGTCVSGVYVSTVGLRNLPGLSKTSWPVTLAVTLLPLMLVCMLAADLFFDYFSVLLAIFGVIFAPLCGIQIADYYLLRRKRIDLKALYDASPQSPYYFYKGFNIAGVLSLAAGFMVYVTLLDPLSYESRWPFEYMTASIPTLILSGALYVLLTKLINGKRMGGY